MRKTLVSHAFKRVARIVAGAVVLAVVTTGIAVLIIRLFTIQQVLVDAPGMALELDTTKFGTNLLFLPTRTLTSELLSTYPLLADVRFEKKIPGTLIVHLTRREPFAVLVSQGVSHAIDEHGLILGGIKDASPYPILSFDVGIYTQGSTLTAPHVLGALSFLRGLDAPRDIQAIRERDSTSLLATMGNTSIYIPQLEDLREKAATLQRMIEGFRIKGTLPTVIDLRFAKPIITN